MPESPSPTIRTASAFPENTSRRRAQWSRPKALLLEFLNPKQADNFRLNDASRTEMLRPQVKTGQAWEGLAWALEQHEGSPMLFAHSGQDEGYYCVAAGCLERRSGMMIMMNGDTARRLLCYSLAESGSCANHSIRPHSAQTRIAAEGSAQSTLKAARLNTAIGVGRAGRRRTGGPCSAPRSTAGSVSCGVCR